MKLRKLIRALAPPLRRELVCERCGRPFTCGASLADCWCEEVKLSEAASAELRRSYRDCLCRGCLEQFAEGKDSPTSRG